MRLIAELPIYGPPLVALLLCIRGVISRDGLGRRLGAVGFALLPAFVPLFGRMWVHATHAPGGTSGTIFTPALMLAPVLSAVYLFAWAFRTADPRWQRVASAILGLIGILPLLYIWPLLAARILN